jgi:homoaconitase
LWFADTSDYSRIGSGDIVETIGLEGLLNGDHFTTIRLKVSKNSGETFEIPTKHTMSADQLNWLLAGSALNYIRSKLQQA